LSGLRAAALAGLGIAIFPEDMIPADLVELPNSHGLPDLGSIEMVLLGAGRTLSGPAAELADAILASGIVM
jgi:DNA-binding transcriptional LysR family regulator